jgi:hypothetical protein
MLTVSGERHVRILLYGVVHVIPDNPHRPRAPITKHKVGWDVDVDLTAGRVVLRVEPPTVLDNLLTIANMHKASHGNMGKL